MLEVKLRRKVSALWSLTFRSLCRYLCRNLTIAAPYLSSLASKTSVLWTLQDAVVEGLLAERRRMITNVRINQYNQMATEIFCGTRVKIWSSARRIAARMNDTLDGLHVRPPVVRAQIQVLVNFLCNKYQQDPDLCCPKQPVFRSV